MVTMFFFFFFSLREFCLFSMRSQSGSLKTPDSFPSTERRRSLGPAPLKAATFQETLNLFFLHWRLSSYLFVPACLKCLTTFNLLIEDWCKKGIRYFSLVVINSLYSRHWISCFLVYPLTENVFAKILFIILFFVLSYIVAKNFAAIPFLFIH